MIVKQYGVLGLVLLSATDGISQEAPTFETIQKEIFNKSCVVCHAPGTTFARQSGLVLTEGQSYADLVDVPAKNAAANAAGLVRVTSEGLISAPHKSFLWEKIDAPNQSHFFQDHPNYGALMPLGQPSLTNGELAFVKQWTEAGAPEDEMVADVALLADTSRYRPPAFQPLAAPSQGFQFHIGPFDVWPAEVHDREFLYFEALETTEDLYVSRYEISMRPGSHHFILYNYPSGKPTPEAGIFRDLRTSAGVPNFTNLLALNDLFPFFFFIGTQVPYTNYYFPLGVALRLPAGSGFDLNSHSVNRSSKWLTGEVYANIYTVQRSEVQHIADYDNFGNYDINLPPNQVSEVSETFEFKEQRHIIQMWSHSHEHTLEFRIEGVGGAHEGQLLYWTNDWEHPPFLELDPPLTFEAGDKIKLVTTYDNWTDEWIQYGPLSSDEMQFLFYIYYTGTVASVSNAEEKPESLSLAQNYPNPFNPRTVINYTIPRSGLVTLRVFDILGNEIVTLESERKTAGEYSLSFEGGSLPSGVYFYTLQFDRRREVRKMILLR